MPYTQEISRTKPGYLIFLLDQSGSMEDRFGREAEGHTGKKKKDGVAEAINNQLYQLVVGATKETEVRDYFDISVIGYGGTVTPALGGSLQGKDLVKISEVAQNPLRVEGTEETYLWVEPTARGQTPMCEALRSAHRLIEQWIKERSDSFPPVLINITDGEATDGNPESEAKRIRDIATSDGNVLVFNCHISSTAGPSVVFPGGEEEVPNDEFARMLYGMSSELPSVMREAAMERQLPGVGQNARGFAFNADLAEVMQLIDIGTRPTNVEA